MLLNAEGLIFTGERLDKPGAWQMPQGGIDEDERPEEAALRELEEEIGVPTDQVTVEAETEDWIPYDLPDHLIGKMWGGRYRGQTQKWFRMRLCGPDRLINIATKHPEFGRWKWSTPDDLIAEIVEFKRPVYQAVVAALLP